MYKLINKLYPIIRSLTGSGNRATLSEIQKIIPIKINEVKSWTKVFDWQVPLEWNIKDAYIKDGKGNKIVDFKDSNLSVVNYSIPINKTVNLNELKKHLYTLPDHPDWIPYKTSYYEKKWGFCLPYNKCRLLKDSNYKVVIDSSLTAGSLTYGELYLPGKLKDEIVISTHICHPSMCNDNLSGIAVSTYLAKYIKGINNRKFSYRFLYIPGTIGSLSWLSLNRDKLKNIAFGLVLTGVGDKGNITYKKSKQGNSEIDYTFESILSSAKFTYKTIDFYPYGYDERQYSSSGFDLSFGTLMRSQHGTYPQYHTSADNLEFISEESLKETLDLCIKAVKLVEKSEFYTNSFPYGEPQLGKRGVFRAMNDVGKSTKELQMAMLWILSYSDGYHSLVHIAKKSKINDRIIAQAAKILSEKKLIKLKE